MHNNIKNVLFTEKEIENIVNSLAKQIEKDYNNREFVMLGLLKGSFVFMADLMRRINLDFAVDFMSVSSYGNGTESSGKITIQKDISHLIENKNILIVEDIIDSGNTLSYIINFMKQRGASSVRLCTLFNKPSRRKNDINIDYVGVEIPDEFIVGYGLDYAENYRNLPYVGILKPSVYS